MNEYRFYSDKRYINKERVHIERYNDFIGDYDFFISAEKILDDGTYITFMSICNEKGEVGGLLQRVYKNKQMALLRIYYLKFLVKHFSINKILNMVEKQGIKRV